MLHIEVIFQDEHGGSVGTFFVCLEILLQNAGIKLINEFVAQRFYLFNEKLSLVVNMLNLVSFIFLHFIWIYSGTLKIQKILGNYQ